MLQELFNGILGLVTSAGTLLTDLGNPANLTIGDPTDLVNTIISGICDPLAKLTGQLSLVQSILGPLFEVSSIS